MYSSCRLPRGRSTRICTACPWDVCNKHVLAPWGSEGVHCCFPIQPRQCWMLLAWMFQDRWDANSRMGTHFHLCNSASSSREGGEVQEKKKSQSRILADAGCAQMITKKVKNWIQRAWRGFLLLLVPHFLNNQLREGDRQHAAHHCLQANGYV